MPQTRPAPKAATANRKPVRVLKRYGPDAALAPGVVRRQAVDLVFGEGELDLALDNRVDGFGRDVEGIGADPARHGQPVEDVGGLVTQHLVDGANIGSLGGHHLPALLDHVPRARIGHQTTFPPTYQTGPCVPTGLVSESEWMISSRPSIPWASARSRQRRTIPGEAP